MDPERLLRGVSTWIAPAAVVTALVVGVVTGLGPALLILAGGMLVGVVLLFWSSLGRLTGESPLTLEEAIGLGAPSPEEERKRSVLRALKDLEYERSVGKISEEDYAELSLRYRAEAKALLQAIERDSAPRRAEAEARLAARLSGDTAQDGGETSPRGKKKRKRTRTAPETPAALSSRRPEAISATERDEAQTIACASCSTDNDVDARFCKRCGAALAPSAASMPAPEEETP